ncbi:MAG: ABC-F family ATP-binding cassette domain-containing protein [Lachnospirales bacterium]
MSILTVSNLTHGFGDRAIFDDVSFRLLKGEHIGLFGANGEGKSTFMNIITRKLEPDFGNIEWSKRVRVGYLDQHTELKKGMSVKDVLNSAFQYLFDIEEEINEMYNKMADATEDEVNALLVEVGDLQDILDHNDFYSIDYKVEETARGLGILDIGLDKDVNDLSGGQRTKILLAKLLLEKPDILLLDEPTNYLDEVHIEWLKKYLLDYENAFILISHDIPFLNSVINIIYHMENQKLDRYVGDYEKFTEVHEMKKKQLEAAYKKQQQEIADLEDFVARNKARVSTRNMAMSRQKKLDKIDVIELAKDKPKPEFNFKEARASGKMVFETKDLVIGYSDDNPLSKPLNLYMERGQKIALVGANGIGKTTLLKSLLGEIQGISGESKKGDYQYIGYFEQETKKDNYNSCIEEVWQEFQSYTQYEVRSALAKCGLTTKHIESKVMVLSGGEQAKVRLCKLINRESNILVLDEPTNHLDIEAKEELKRALKSYKGSILIICHEPEFYNDVVDIVWNLEEYTTKIV